MNRSNSLHLNLDDQLLGKTFPFKNWTRTKRYKDEDSEYELNLDSILPAKLQSWQKDMLGILHVKALIELKDYIFPSDDEKTIFVTGASENEEKRTIIITKDGWTYGEQKKWPEADFSLFSNFYSSSTKNIFRADDSDCKIMSMWHTLKHENVFWLDKNKGLHNMNECVKKLLSWVNASTLSDENVLSLLIFEYLRKGSDHIPSFKHQGPEFCASTFLGCNCIG